MKHEPLPVAGYTAQSDVKVALVNASKELEERVLRVLDELYEHDIDVDYHWLEIGRRFIEQGFMAVNRGIFQPDRITLPEDQTEDEPNNV